MGLRRQLLLVGSVFLLLPLAVVMLLREMEQVLRIGQQQALVSVAEAQAFALSQITDIAALMSTEAVDTKAEPLYQFPLASSIILDGYVDDWLHLALQPQVFTRGDQTLSVTQASDGLQSFGVLELAQSNFQFHDPASDPVASGDYIALAGLSNQGPRALVLRTSTPGEMQAMLLTEGGLTVEHRAKAFWRETEQGYRVEFSLPSGWFAGSLCLGVYKAHEQRWLGSCDYPSHRPEPLLTWVGNHRPPPVVATVPQLRNQLKSMVRGNQRLKLVDASGRILASWQAPAEQASELPMAWLMRWLLQDQALAQFDESLTWWVLEQPEVQQAIAEQQVNLQWYRYGQHDNLLRVAAPIIVNGVPLGALVAEQRSQQWLGLADVTFRRLLMYSAGAVVLVAVILLAYASWLSWRIRRLSVAVNRAVSADGSIGQGIASSVIADEIGDLSRGFSRLIIKVAEYNQYLRTLASKLSHELRTPLAIVQSSLDNLGSGQSNTPDIYLERAQQGAKRLSAILTSMNAAQRLEEAITQAECESVDLTDLLAQLVAAYQSVHQDKNLTIVSDLPDEPVMVWVAPDLLVQMLDKLLDNAVDFCSPGGVIRFSLSAVNDRVRLCVSNTGPSLPEAMSEQIFGSLVSVRDESSSHTHLGLGLHLVKLIVDFHRGRIRAINLSNPNEARAAGLPACGVQFEITLPLNLLPLNF